MGVTTHYNYQEYFNLSLDELSSVIQQNDQSALDQIDAAKYILALRNVQQLESNGTDQFIQMLRDQGKGQFANMLGPIKEFKHLITVPNRHSSMSQSAPYQEVFALEKNLSFETLEKIYTAAWANVNLTSLLNLVVMEPLGDYYFPNYAFNGMCNGLVQKYPIIAGFGLPFAVDSVQLDQLCEAFKGRKVDQLCLTLRSGISIEVFQKFLLTVEETGMKNVTLNGLPVELKDSAEEAAQRLGIALKLITVG